MKRKILLGVGLLAVYMLALVANVPATQVLPRATPLLEARGVRLAASGIEGTLWSGRAASSSVNGIAVGQSEWSLSPWRLLFGEAGLGFKLAPEGGYLSGDVRLGSGSVAVAGVEGELPATAVLAGLPRLPMPVEVGGTVMVQLKALDWAGGKLEAADGAIVWRQAELRSPMPARLGDLKVELAPGPNGSLLGKLSDGGGPLGIKGDVTFGNGSYRINAVLTPRANTDPALAQALTLLGAPDSQGGYRLTWAGRI
ncbi:MAG: type II secretion system protein N [Thiohalomonadaceae bacterium]